FYEQLGDRRLIIVSTKAARNYTELQYTGNDTLLFGRESAGLPDHIHQIADVAVLIPMQPGARSLNLAVSVAILASEAARQLVF
ncbi:MAG: tRNA (cytidine(34)-2'-O)-methyltransferase, partial [Notoacmeibacter sp.]